MVFLQELMKCTVKRDRYDLDSRARKVLRQLKKRIRRRNTPRRRRRPNFWRPADVPIRRIPAACAGILLGS